MSKQNPRQRYGETLVKLGRENPKIVVLEADLGLSTMSALFQKEFPHRYFEMGIAEANMTSFAAGLAATGLIPFTNSFAVFSLGRAYDQARQGVATANLHLIIHGSSAGFSDFGDGATHQAVEDVAIACAIPNMTVLVPADANQVESAVRAAVDFPGPVYIRTTRNDMEDVTLPGEPFEIGRIYPLKHGRDAVIFACGTMVHPALLAANMLGAQGISCKVINMPTIKPVSAQDIAAAAAGTRAIVTAEEGSAAAGLSTIVAAATYGMGIPMGSVAIRDSFGASAKSAEELLQAFGLTPEGIASAVLSALHG